MLSSSNGADRINCFAVVTYIPDPLGEFLDGLRLELVPSCDPHAHVTILTPRPLAESAESAWKALRAHAEALPPFEVETAGIEVFEATSVIYLAVGAGQAEFRHMNQVLNAGPLQYAEPYAYHPHVTLAQEIEPDAAPEMAELARRRWEEYPYPRTFPADRLTFVQNTARNRWLDLAQCTLGGAARSSSIRTFPTVP